MGKPTIKIILCNKLNEVNKCMVNIINNKSDNIVITNSVTKFKNLTTLEIESVDYLIIRLDRYLEKKGGAFSQVMAMLLDYIPEAMALGAVFSADRNMGFLLALYIGIQNLPESFNAFLEMRTGGYSSKKRLILFLILSFLGIAASVSGYYLLSDHPKGTAALMLFSSGGIIYLIFQDIAPMSKINKNWLPALGASLGFLFGMIGLKIMG